MDNLSGENQDPSGSGSDPNQPQAAGAANGSRPETRATPETENAQKALDERLAEIRRSLREEEPAPETGFRLFLSRLSGFFSRKKRKPAEAVTSEPPNPLEAYEIPESRTSSQPSTAPAAALPPVLESEPEPEAPEHRPGEATLPETDQEFSTLVQDRLGEVLARPEELVPAAAAPAVEPEPPAEQPPAETGKSILSSLREPEAPEAGPAPVDIRQEALEDYQALPDETEEEARPSVGRRIRRSWRDMRPLERTLLTGALALIGVAVVVGSGFLVIKSLPARTPKATPTTSLLPYPISLSLPGGWVFPLGIGNVENGRWDPKGPEWLQGTEVCRWVSLPWTVQLEAVLRTLNANDQLSLSMSNYDNVIYKVQSIQQVPSSDIAKLAQDTPCLLVILAKEDTNTRWVVIGKP